MKKQNIIIWQENLVASEMQIFISFEKAANIFVKWQQVKTKKYDVTNTSGIVQVSCNVLDAYIFNCHSDCTTLNLPTLLIRT